MVLGCLPYWGYITLGFRVILSPYTGESNGKMENELESVGIKGFKDIVVILHRDIIK